MTEGKQLSPVQRKRGNRLGIGLFRLATRFTGLRGAYGLLYPVCAYYLLFDRAAVQSALAYLRRRFPDHTPRQLRGDAFRLFIAQGKGLIDRHALIAGAFPFDLGIVNYKRFEDRLKEGKGAVLLMSHTGSWQAAMSALSKMDKTIHLLMRPEDNVAVRDAVKVDASNQRIKVISPEGHLGGVVEMMRALGQGDVVSIMGDRTYGADSVTVEFLGSPAQFPYSAFHLAAAAKAPVVVMFSSKSGLYVHEVDISDVFDPVLDRSMPKIEALQQWVQRYVRSLEAFIEKYPYQYFAFRDMWKDGNRPECSREERP